MRFSLRLSLKVAAVVSIVGFASCFVFSQGAAACAPISFATAPEYATGDGPSGVAIADLDGDGLPDIAVAFSGATSGFSVLRNLGGGSFAPKVDFLIPPGVTTISLVFARDIDSDGRVDIVLSSSLNNKISIFRNMSTGAGDISFGPRVDYLTAGDKSSPITFGDFDGDGAEDLATANQTTPSSISVFRNISRGTGTITLAPKVDFAVPGGDAHSIATGDFDGDGKPDIAVGASGSGRKISILRNSSSGIGNLSFTASNRFDITNEASSIVATDLDGDGKTDVAVAVGPTNSVSILLNQSSGPGNISFAASINVATGLLPQALIASDLDGDGTPDLATSNFNGNSITVLRNLGSAPGTISFAPRPWDFGAGISPAGVAVGDLNLDGKSDLVIADGTSNSVSVLISDRPSTGTVDFVTRKDYQSLQGSGISSLSSGDFDGDGNQDLLASLNPNGNISKFSIFAGDGTGFFPSRTDVPTGSKYSYVAATDISGDGRPDVVGLWSPGFGSTNFNVLKNISAAPGSFSFTPVFSGTLPIAAQSVQAVDFDSDGKKDLLFSGSNERAFLYHNESPDASTFSWVLVKTILNVRGISLEDLDGDGKIDIIYATKGDPNDFLTILRNTSPPGQLTFETSTLQESGTSLGAPLTADVDGDGRGDIIAASGEYTDVVYKNIRVPGSVAFSPGYTLSNRLPFPITDKAGLDSDGKIDLVVGAPDGFLAVMRNTSTATGSFSFDEPRQFAIGNNPLGGASYASFVFNDFNHDGKLDIASGVFSINGVVSVLLNTSCVPTPTPTPTPGPSSVAFSASSYNVGEAGGHVDVTVARTGDTSGSASVNYTTLDETPGAGHASQASDYQIAVGTLTFAPGETSKTFSVLVVDDSLVEGSETIGLALSNATGSNVSLGSPNTAEVTIVDNDSVSTTVNPYDDARFFVRQHYLDFLNREPDQSGWDFWTGVITQCGTDAACTEVNRINVSAAYFLSNEFQNTGYLAYLTHRSAFGPTAGVSPAPVLYTTFMHDVQELGKGYVFTDPNGAQVLEANKVAYFNEFVARPEFLVKYPASLTNQQYVDNLLTTATLPTTGTFHDSLVTGLNNASMTRATVLRAVAESSTIQTRELNAGFVTMEYFGYLRRDPDTSGFNFWLTKLNSFNGNYIQAEMVKAFIESAEDRQRFGTP
jgi:hypothetical protein